MITFLGGAALLLLAVIAVQNYLYPPLRQETISDGLFGPYHWLLDGAYAILATALVFTFLGQALIAQVLAYTIAGCLGITAISNTFSGWVDKLTNGKHATIHTWFTIVMFLAVFALEYHQSGWMWVAANITLPLITGGILTVFKKLGILAGPAAEKVAATVMCLWLMTL